MKRKLAMLMTGLLTISMLGGCGNSANTDSIADTSATDTAAANEQSTGQSDTSTQTASSGSAALTIAWWGNQTRNERTQQVLDLYSSANEGITFDGQFAEWADYWTKLATASAGHTLPDIIQMDYSYLEQYVSNGLLVDLTPYIEDGTIDVSNISDNALDPGRVGDGLYAINAGVNVPTVVYNKTLLDENGITINDNMTLEEFYAVCRDVYEKTGYKTDVFYGNGADYLGYVMRGEGTHLYGEDGKLQATEDELKKFFDIYETGMAEGWMCDPSIYAERTIGTPEQMPLVYGSSPATMSWCSFTWSNSLASLRNAAPEGVELAITTWPSANPTASNYLKPSMFFCITTDSANPDESAAFINYWTNDVEANKILLGERGIPISSAVADGISELMDANQQDAADFINNVVTPNSSTIDAPMPEGAAEVTQMVNQLVEKVCYGEVTAAEAANQLYTQGSAALEK
ncbi:MAG: extracellular solute-binding protein [Lachnospiraceae bacterium]|nr:extracellular solute-binding protein [Lachnospiraceae bacterium]